MTVTNGLFTVQLDFGAGVFNGDARFPEISVRPHSDDPNSPAYTTLSPRQQITSTPYAIRSISAGSADTAASATTATNFSGSLSGDVTWTQGATAVASVGGQTAANVASGAAAPSGGKSLTRCGPSSTGVVPQRRPLREAKSPPGRLPVSRKRMAVGSAGSVAAPASGVPESKAAPA